jgi:TPR repeat protein
MTSLNDGDLPSLDAQDHLLTNTKALAGKLIRTANYHKNLSTLKASEQLVHKIKEVFFEVEKEDKKLRDTLSTSEFVQKNLENLLTTLIDVEKFFDDLTKITVMMFVKSSVERKLQDHLHILRGKMTQLMTSVSLELLSRPAAKPADTPKAPNSIECNIGFAYFYGIGRPRNLTTAYEKFRYGAEDGDTECMYMLAMCFAESFGVDHDEVAGRAWLERAAELGCPSAMTELAVTLINSVNHRDHQLLTEVLHSIVNRDPRSPLIPQRKGPDTNETYIDDSLAAIDAVEERFSRSSRNWLRRNSGSGYVDGESKSAKHTPSRPQSTQSLTPFSPNRRRSESDYYSQMGSEIGTPARERKAGEGDDEADAEMERHREEADLLQAVHLLLRAAEKDYAAAMTNLGAAFEVVEDYANAAKWYVHSAYHGN